MFNLNKKNLIYSFVFILFVLFLANLASSLKSTLSDISSLPLSLFTAIKQEIGGIIFYHHNLIENQRLNDEVASLKNKINSLTEYGIENARLKGLLEFKQNSSYKLVAARIIGHSPDNWSSSVIIDKGTSRGIKPGMVVITNFGFVGRVLEVSKLTSKLTLANDPDFAISAIDQRSRQEGLACGSLGSTLIMKFLPKDVDIKIGDRIVTAGLTQSYPKGIVIGDIIEVGQEISGLSSYCMIKPAVNFSDIEEVFIIIP